MRVLAVQAVAQARAVRLVTVVLQANLQAQVMQV
jgi:hypothetical protein